MKSRPFLIDVDKGAQITADLIERGVGYATVPRFPWTLITPLLRVLPTSWLARSVPQRAMAKGRPERRRPAWRASAVLGGRGPRRAAISPERLATRSA